MLQLRLSTSTTYEPMYVNIWLLIKSFLKAKFYEKYYKVYINLLKWIKDIVSSSISYRYVKKILQVTRWGVYEKEFAMFEITRKKVNFCCTKALIPFTNTKCFLQ